MNRAHSIIKWQSYDLLMFCCVSLWDKPAQCEERITEGALIHALLSSSTNHGTSSGSSTRNSSGSSTDNPNSAPVSGNTDMHCLSKKLIDLYTDLYIYIYIYLIFFFLTYNRAFTFLFLFSSRPVFAVRHWGSEMLQSVFKVCGVTDVGFSMELTGCRVIEETPGVSGYM